VICVASLLDVLGLELFVTRDQVLCSEPIVKLLVPAVVPEGNCDADNKKGTNHDDVNSELSV